MAPQARTASNRIASLHHPWLLLTLIVLTPAAWILFVNTTNPHELLVGAAASLATIVFTIFVCRCSPPDIALRPRDMAQCWRIPWYIVEGVCDITFVLIKDLLHLATAENLYRVCGFDTSLRDPVRTARTVLAVGYTTTSPNFIVIGVDPGRSRMLFHQISASAVPEMTKSLGAKA